MSENWRCDHGHYADDHCLACEEREKVNILAVRKNSANHQPTPAPEVKETGRYRTQRPLRQRGK